MGLQQVWLSYNQLFNLLFFFFLFLCNLTCLHAQLCTQEQTSALQQFKRIFSFNKNASRYCDDFGITSFPKMESWKKGSDCCSWDGVECDRETGRVIGLDLSCSWLQGTIHPNSSLFLSFPHLQKLNLAYNNFSMSRISPEFTQLTELTHLNLSLCGFWGKVPPRVSFLNKLVSLDLSYNFDLRLEEGWFELLIQNLSKLRDLDLSEVNISSSVFPNSLLNLTSLRTLDLSGSRLHGEVPPRISYLNKLVSLDLSYNYDLRLEENGFELLIQNLSKLRDLSLTGVNMSSSVVPNSLLNLTFLRTLGLGESGLHGEFPSGVFHLPHLQDLIILNEEGLTGHIPDFINSTYPLQHLLLFDSGISGILPDSIANLKSMKQLVIYHSEFHGSIPTSLWNLPQITFVDLSFNNFSGILPSLISNLTQITSLDLSHNNFHGILPSSISNLTQITSLDLSSNNFHSILPSSISNLTQITSLDLSSNNFHGILPSSISNLTQITSLDLSSNNFSGVLPSSISNLKNLKALYLANNYFTGPFFSWDTIMPQLEILVVSNNSLTGPLPSQVVVPPNLSYLIVDRNLINGTIPSWVFELPALKYLDISYNKLSGQTLEFQSSSLEFIDLSYNDLHGTVPNSTFELRNLTHLILSSNSFSGTIPRSNRFSENLEVLALKKNNFSGTIHDSFTRRNSLTTINLYGNGFEGPIPKSLINCRYLKVLDLGRNKFFEEFPHWLGNLPNLHVLILQSNKFHGSIVTSTTKFPFPMLRVLDMANNNFTGPLPIKYFKSFKAMMNVDEHFRLEYMGTYYSLTIVIKGSTVEMEKVLKVFTAIDLSKNKFQGEIPRIIGGLNSIRGLNLSHNSLTGHIPKSLGNLTKLEWLDLSSNKLTGEIPQQLTNLTFLGTLNLSQNRLTGPIPRGKQFDTFSNDSYVNNLALCGPPLSNTCGDPKATQPPPSTFEEEDSEPVSGFGWEVILPGYGFGLVVGLVMGYLMFSFGKPQWLVKMVEGVGNRKGKRLKSNARRRGGRRN